eukprot:scaffold133_cov257-Pinguiococcus_pyrenoidosus.AAC.10
MKRLASQGPHELLDLLSRPHGGHLRGVDHEAQDGHQAKQHDGLPHQLRHEQLEGEDAATDHDAHEARYDHGSQHALDLIGKQQEHRKDTLGDVHNEASRGGDALYLLQQFSIRHRQRQLPRCIRGRRRR